MTDDNNPIDIVDESYLSPEQLSCIIDFEGVMDEWEEKHDLAFVLECMMTLMCNVAEETDNLLPLSADLRNLADACERLHNSVHRKH